MSTIEIENSAYLQFQKEWGMKRAQKYFNEVHRLFPNTELIIRYQRSGVVVFKDGNNIFYPLCDMDLKVWRIGEWKIEV